MEKTRTFKLTEITKILGVKQHFVIHLVEKGIIIPLQDAIGRGSSRLYSYQNLIEIGVFLYLSKLDLSYGAANKVLGYVRKQVETRLIDCLLYVAVIGQINGEIEMWGYPGFPDYPKERSPGEFLMERVEEKIRTKPDLSKEDFAYYFILDVSNITKFINTRIQEL